MTDVQLLPLLGVPLENSLQLPAPSGIISTCREALPPRGDEDQPRLRELTMHAVTQHPEHSAWFNVPLLPSWKP